MQYKKDESWLVTNNHSYSVFTFISKHSLVTNISLNIRIDHNPKEYNIKYYSNILEVTRKSITLVNISLPNIPLLARNAFLYFYYLFTLNDRSVSAFEQVLRGI